MSAHTRLTLTLCFGLAMLGGGPLRTARAEVLSLTVGIDSQCPYGIQA